MHGWSLDREKWEHLASSISVCNWEKVNFSPSMASSVPEEPGVYMLCSVPPECPESLKKIKLNNVMYAGMATKSIRDRFNDHIGRSAMGTIKELRKNFHSELYFWYSKLDISKVESVEDILIECFWPATNRDKKIYRVGLEPPGPA